MPSQTKQLKGYQGGPLDGKVALITGSGRGIGKGMALELGSRGASVVINYANAAQGAEETVKEIEAAGSKAFAIKADVTKLSDITRLFKEAVAHFGRLDIVGSPFDQALDFELTETRWYQTPGPRSSRLRTR